MSSPSGLPGSGRVSGGLDIARLGGHSANVDLRQLQETPNGELDVIAQKQRGWHIATKEADVAQSIKISDEEMDVVRKEAELSSRSLAGQVAHWLRIGRSIERAPEFNYARVRQALAGVHSPDALNGDEQIVFVDELLSAAAAETPEQSAFFEGRRKAGLGVGANAQGKVVRQAKRKKV